MPGNGHQVLGRIYNAWNSLVGGQVAIKEAASQNGFHQAIRFDVCTGGSNGLIPDVTPGQGSNVTLIADSRVPSNARCYVTEAVFTMQGAANWVSTSPTPGSVPGVLLQDSAGSPIAKLPYNALLGRAQYAFPTDEVVVPLLLGPNTVSSAAGTPIDTFTYVPATGVITMGHTNAVAGYGIGSPIAVVDGTGVGQTAIVTAITATTITVSPPFVGLAADSVIGMEYQTLQTYTSTTDVTLWNGSGTPYTPAQLENRFALVSVLGTGLGQAVPIGSGLNTGELTLGGGFQTHPAQATSLFVVTSRSGMRGAADLSIGRQWANCGLGKGLQVSVNHYGGTSPGGSAVRVHVKGYIAP